MTLSAPTTSLRVLTVQQPYAWFLSLPVSHPLCKRVENRSWPTSYRGPVAIHAGLSQDSMQHPEFAGMEKYRQHLHYGKIICVRHLVDCIRADQVEEPWEGWLESQRQVGHAVGPWLHIFGEEVKPVDPPIPVKGQQGYFSLTHRSLR